MKKDIIIIIIVTAIITSIINLAGIYMMKNQETTKNANNEIIEVSSEKIYSNNEAVTEQVQENHETLYENESKIEENILANIQENNNTSLTNAANNESSQTLSNQNNTLQTHNNLTNQTAETSEVKKEYIENYEVIGYMKIPKIQLYVPVLEHVTLRSLEIAVGKAYGTLNEAGNTVIMGHGNTGKAFENIPKLEVGDIINITDSQKQEITYEIYDKQIVSNSDGSYFKRETNGLREITLQTGNTDTTRLIVLAREKTNN